MNKKHHWLDIAEYATLVGLGLGSIASFASAQFFYSSAPLSLLILLNLANRNRMEQVFQQNTENSIEDIDQRISKNLELLHHQIQGLPTPEAIGALRKSMLVKNRELAERLEKEIRTLQDGMQSVLQVVDHLNLGTARQDLDHLQTQYNSLNDGVANLAMQFQHLAASGKFEDLEQAIAQLQSESKRIRASLQSLADQTKPTLTSLQDQINHLNRQFQKLPPPFDSTALKQEVAELVRVVADLVPKREWSSLVTELQVLQKLQESQSEAEEGLRRKIQEIGQQLQARPTKSSLTSLQNQINHLNRQFQKLPPPFDPTSLKREVAKLLKVVADLVPRRDFGGLVAQVKALQQQQEFQMKVEHTLREELQTLNEQLRQLVVESESQPKLPTHREVPQQEFQSRLEGLLHREIAQISTQLQNLPPTGSEIQAQVAATLRQELMEVNRHLQSYPEGPKYELILDFKQLSAAAEMQGTPGVDDLHTSRSILEDALARSQERLIVILPWSSQVALDDDLMARMEAFLQQRRRLDLGWCHQTDRTQERLLKPIHQRWQLHADLHDDLQTTLQKLLHLKRNYPDVLQFKILGTRENFLVSDRHYAVLGLEDALVGATNLPDLELKLRTTDEEAIQQLIQRFDAPVLRANDAIAYWNRAVTRFDLGDRQGALEDCNQILTVNAEDAAALNFRGMIRYDLDDRQNAIADFNQSLQFDPQQTAAYCNRGFIRSELGDQLGAIADYSAALRINDQSAVTYFLRGMSCQKFGELAGAIADYSEALRFTPDSAILYYYRGLARPKLGDYEGAIADLQQALNHFTQQGNEVNARKVFNYLQQLQHSIPRTPVVPIVTPEATAVVPPITSAEGEQNGSYPHPPLGSLSDSVEVIVDPSTDASVPDASESILPESLAEPVVEDQVSESRVAESSEASGEPEPLSMETLASLFSDDDDATENPFPLLGDDAITAPMTVVELAVEPEIFTPDDANDAVPEEEPTFLASPLTSMNGSADPATLTLSNFWEDVDQSEDLGSTRWEPMGLDESGPTHATLTTSMNERDNNHSQDTLSDFCNFS